MDVVPISAYFVPEDEDIEVLGEILGGVSFPPSTRVRAWRTYGDELRADIVATFPMP